LLGAFFPFEKAFIRRRDWPHLVEDDPGRALARNRLSENATMA
jgi:hypothetical protein